MLLLFVSHVWTSPNSQFDWLTCQYIIISYHWLKQRVSPALYETASSHSCSTHSQQSPWRSVASVYCCHLIVISRFQKQILSITNRIVFLYNRFTRHNRSCFFRRRYCGSYSQIFQGERRIVLLCFCLFVYFAHCLLICRRRCFCYHNCKYRRFHSHFIEIKQLTTP